MNSFRNSLLNHLDEIAFFLEYRGENPFRIRAFHRALDSLANLSDEELQEKITSKSLLEIEGIGKGILAVCESYLKSERSLEGDEARGDLPDSLLELRKITGLGPKKIRALYEELKIMSLSDLEKACNENRLASVKSFGEKTQAKILEALEAIKMHAGKLLLSQALLAAKNFEEKLSELTFYRVGDLGKCLEMVATLDYLVDEAVLSQLKQSKMITILGQKKNLIEAVWSGLRMNFYFSDRSQLPYKRVVLTSSAEHLASLERFASKEKLSIESTSFRSEEDLYVKLGLPFYEVFERELPAAAKKISKVCVEDLTGAFHLHTTYSDGKNSLSEMAEAAHQMGWSFMGLSDHSKTAFYAKGLSEADIERQWKEVESLSKKMRGFKIFRGIESDILKDGALDYSDTFLKKFDFVIASIHSRYGMTEMTDRLLKALEHPRTTMLGHLTGRLLLEREGYAVNHSKIIEAAIKHRKIIELNAHPQRLDMDWRFLSEACKKGLLISINPDAHSTDGLKAVQFGVWMARKAGVPSKNILNTWSLPEISKFLSL